MSDSEKPTSDNAGGLPVPKGVVSRLSLYQRELQQLIRDGRDTTNSTQLGNRLGITDAQIRKDLTHFGQFGYPGIGYRCDELVCEIKKILGTDRTWRTVIVGLGNLGTALLGYRGFAEQGFQIIAGFEVAPAKIGQKIHGIPVYSLEQMSEKVEHDAIRLAILAVPAAEAQRVAEQLVAAGVIGILNFAPVTILLPSQVSIASVDLAIELEQLSFSVVNRRENG